MNDLQIIHGDARHLPLADDSVQCIVTSPPYWGLRKYAGEQELIWPALSSHAEDVERCPTFGGGADGWKHQWGGQIPLRGKTNLDTFFDEATGKPKKSVESIAASQPEGHGNFCQKCGAWRGAFGLEPTIEMYIAHSCVVLAECARVLRPDGVIFWNIGDSYASGKGTCYNPGGGFNSLSGHTALKEEQAYPLNRGNKSDLDMQGLKPKDLCLIPERIALAAQQAGWWVRSRILWCKPNPMPESVTDRPTDAAEHIWMFTKSARYFWDAEAVRESAATPSNDTSAHAFKANGGKTEEVFGYKPKGTHSRGTGNGGPKAQERGSYEGWADGTREVLTSRNMRNVWMFATQPYPEAHFATFPEELPRRCILAATSEKGACVQCGTPWERVTEQDVHFEGGSSAAKSRGGFASWRGDRTIPSETRLPTAKGAGGQQIESGDYDIRMGPVVESRTIGWQPGCKCRGQKGRTVPCLVLDPFGGSGTTGKVAIELGRRAVLVDIAYQETKEKKAGYRALAEKRTRNIQRPLLT